MRKTSPSLALALAVALSVVPLWTPASASTLAIRAEPLATGLAFPAGFTFAPDGRLFYGERYTGEVRILDPATGFDSLFFTVPNLLTTGEKGLLGLAIHPAYPSAPYVYAWVTRTVSGTPRAQVLRIVDAGGSGSSMKAIWSGIVSEHHNGSRILFGPDGRLYVVTGDHADPANSQDLTNDYGKILRMTPGGGVPADNPFPGSRIWAYGIRNSAGFGFDPITSELWETDNGPECNDELNRIIKGRNYGWGPTQTCATPPEPPLNTNQDGPSPVLPKRHYTPPIAPTGLAFCNGCGLGADAENRLFFGDFNDGNIRKVTLTPDRLRVQSQVVVYTHPSFVLGVEAAPDGSLYFSDSSGIYELVMA